MYSLPVFALALLLSTSWWGAIVRATAKAAGSDAPPAVEQPASPPTTESAASIDPLG